MRGRIQPHLEVHRRCDQQRAITRQTQGGQQIIRQPVRKLGDEISTRRRDHNRIRSAAQIDVRHAVGHSRIPLVGVHRLTGQSLHRGRRDEMARCLGHDDLYFHALFDQQTQQLRCLVGCNAASDAQDYAINWHDVFCLGLFHNAAHLNKKHCAWANVSMMPCPLSKWLGSRCRQSYPLTFAQPVGDVVCGVPFFRLAFFAAFDKIEYNASNAIILGKNMANITVRNLDDHLKTRLRTQAALHGWSMEQEVREILHRAVMPIGKQAGFAQRINQRFAGLEVHTLPIPARQKIRKSPPLGSPKPESSKPRSPKPRSSKARS